MSDGAVGDYWITPLVISHFTQQTFISPLCFPHRWNCNSKRPHIWAHNVPGTWRASMQAFLSCLLPYAKVSLHMNPRRFGDSLILPVLPLKAVRLPEFQHSSNAEHEYLKEDAHYSCLVSLYIKYSNYQKMEYLDTSHWTRLEVLATELLHI